MDKDEFLEFLDTNNDFILEFELAICRALHFNDAFSEETQAKFEQYAEWFEEYKQQQVIE